MSLWRRWGVVFLAVPLVVGWGSSASAANCSVVDDGYPTIFWDAVAGTSGLPDFICSSNHCAVPAQRGEVTMALVDPNCLPFFTPCTVEVRVPLQFPHNHENSGQLSRPSIWWFAGAAPSGCAPPTNCGDIASCGFLGGITTDFVDTGLRLTPSCSTLDDPNLRLYTVQAWSCTVFTGCHQKLEIPVDLTPEKMAAFLDCPPEPPPEICGEDAQCASCAAPGVNVGGGGHGAGGPGAAAGPGAYLRYAAGGAGHPGLPGSVDWNLTLGRYWSHDYAQRIVEAPDDSHVWLITQYGTFREFGNLSGGVYQTLAPSDEYRTLHRTGSGWELHDLDGTVMAFDGAGRWLSTTDRHGNAKTALYGGSGLDSVSFPDGRREDFAYHPSGKLASITEVGVDGISEQEWIYTWNGDDLVRIDRPDGTALEYLYDDPAYPGYLTRITLVGTDGTSERVLQAYELDTDGRVAATWKGDVASDGPDAVELWTFSYDSDSQTTVTDPLGQEIVYTYERDDDSAKVKVTQISGDCPTCGLGPNSQMTYGDVHPLLPTQTVDGNGNVTTMTYDLHGRMTSRTEADTALEERTTTWSYDATFPALVTEVRRPSVQPGADRVVLTPRDANGNVPVQEIRGFEDGVAFDCSQAGAPCYETVTTFNAAGQPETIDPPGHGTADVTTYTYDPARGDLVMDSRIDPLIGATTYGHDAFNRRISTTDPNGVTTETFYDDLDRVTAVVQRGATPAEDLVTVYEHNVFGDLLRTILPEGNVIEYGYDAAGRITRIERKPDAATPGERTVYTLDAAGNRTNESLQRWDGSAWVQASTTAYEYSTRCHLDRVLTPDGAISEYAYDCNGNLERMWDGNHPSANQTAPPSATYTYDALDRITAVTRPWAGAGGRQSVTSYGYDVQDHLVSVQDAEGTITAYDYSDRDLLTLEDSPVSGETHHVYDGHGERVQTTDARGIVETRTLDPLDRVTLVDYPGTDLDVTYTYDDPMVTFSKGRLTAITRNGHSIDYEYDRFGRMTRDGDLTFAYDANGNRTAIGYPGAVTAAYTHDFADREATLTVTTPAGATPVVTGTAYLPSGPLSSLTFGTGATETRGFTTRYFPQSITLDAEDDRAWAYQVDLVGNIERIEAMTNCLGTLLLEAGTVTGEEMHVSCAGIEAGGSYSVASTGELTLTAATRVVLKDGFSVASGGKLTVGTDSSLDSTEVREYDYLDYDYFLTSATGYWGTQSWTYDRIGNRLTETDNGLTDSYTYEPNALTGNTAKLTSIALAVGGTRTFDYSDAGHQTQVNSAGNVIDFQFDAAGRISEATRSGNEADFLYDGRSYLRQAGNAASSGTTTPTYDSAGLVHSLLHQPAGGGDPTRYVILYLAGRPVGQVALENGQADRWWYLTTDHLGTPLVATDAAGAELWENRLGPFGEDTMAGTAEGALQNEIFLRFPGQWEDSTWQDAMMR